MNENDIKYSVNEEKRKVVAYIPNGYTALFEEVYRKLRKISPYLASAFYNSKKARKVIADKNMSMVAKCDPKDEWDEEKGRAIARAKLLAHQSNMRLRLYTIAYDVIDEWSVRITDIFSKELVRNENLRDEVNAHSGYPTDADEDFE